MILWCPSAESSAPGKPRASGDDPAEGLFLHMEARVNPARAGMILSRKPVISRPSSKPRASGDDPVKAAVTQLNGAVNPARAGMILALGRLGRQIESKPRASGDDPNVGDGDLEETP